jgi:thymidylate synthase
VDSVKVMLGRPARRLPTVVLTEAGGQVTDIHDFRAEHFELSDYEPHPAISSIPVAP